MEQNVFLKNNKYNPDILQKLSSEKTIRNNISYNMSNVIYNPITGIVPDKINSNDDLKLQKDIQINSNDFKKLVQDKERERIDMFSNINSNNSNSNNSNSNNNNNIQKINNIDRTNYIQTFQELKNPPKKINTNYSSNNTGVINELKNLGIFN
jgi:hypothetical protein